MEKIIKFPKEIHEDLAVSPWDNTPSRNPARTCKHRQPSKEIAVSLPVSPYRPRAIPQKPVARRYSTIIQDITFNTPARSKEFPKRIFKSPNRLPREINRCNSCSTKEGISVSDLEQIERVQQLIPYKPCLLVSTNQRSSRGSQQLKTDTVLGSGIVKESTFTSTFYKKFNKYNY
jgi:hypothetical protein